MFKGQREMVLHSLSEMTNRIYILKTTTKRFDSDVRFQKYRTKKRRENEHWLKREEQILRVKAFTANMMA